MIRLSLCIATFRRAAFIGETLASIGEQLVDGVEVVVLDGASPDDTAAVVGAAAVRWPAIRYFRAETNSGVDADYDLAVGHARGDWVWLCADDDLLAPGAIATVLAELARSDPDLLVVDAEIRDRDVARRFEPGRLKFRDRREYSPADNDRFMTDAGNALSFIGGTVIRRAAWLTRDRARFYGSLFIHVGVVFQSPALPRRVVLPQPLVRIRIGNAMWTARTFEIWFLLWPRLIWSFPDYGDAAKAAVIAREPWRQASRLLLFRARGGYGAAEYRRFVRPVMGGAGRVLALAVAAVPGRLAHVVTVCGLSAFGRGRGSMMYELLRTSAFSNPLSRAVARLTGGAAPQ